MSKKKLILKILVAGAAMIGAYKLYKHIDEENKKKEEELNKHREEVLNELEGTLHQAEEWNKDIKDITLNNEHIKPSDRAFAYTLLKDKFDAIVDAKTISAIDEARKDFEELHSILAFVNEPETIEGYLKIEMDKQLRAEKMRQERVAKEIELEKYKRIGDIIERIGTKAICNLAQ